MGQYPFITGWIPIVLQIGQNGQFPETVEFCNLRKARDLPLFALDGWKDGWMMGWTTGWMDGKDDHPRIL
jgi:hypothetical protein